MHSIVFAKKPKDADEAHLDSINIKPEVSIPKKKNLQDLWVKDPVTKHGVDLITELVNKGFELKTDNLNVQTDLYIIDKNTDISDFMDMMARDSIVFGTSFGEYLYNKKKNKIIGLWNMDPVSTDFIRDTNQKIQMDETKPKGYIQDVGFMADSGSKKIESTTSGQRGILFKSDKMFHFSFETFSGTVEGISNLMTISDIIKDKMEAEIGLREAIKRFGIPITVVTAGDERHPVTPQGRKEIRESLDDIKRKSVIVVPHYQKVELMQPKQMSKISENLDYYNEQIAIGLGIPKSLITGAGESSNRSVLRQLTRLFVSRIEKRREREREFLVRNLLPFIASVNKWKEIPTPTWQPVTLEDVESLAKRMVGYVDKGILLPEEAKKYISDSEGEVNVKT